MRPYKIVSEHDDHMVVHVDGESKPFKVAIGNKHHATVQKIRKYAKGGLVKDMGPETGGETPSPFDLEDLRQREANRQGMQSVSDFWTGALESIQDPEYVARKHAEQAAAVPAQPPAPAANPALQNQGPTALDTSTPMREPGDISTVPPPGPGAQVQGFAEQQAQAVQQKGTAEQEGMQQISGIQSEAAKHVQESVAQGQQLLTQRMAHQEDLFNRVASEKIDPNRFWQTRSTGQKIAASIGLILGGIGAGLTKGPNYAFETIQNAINRDLEAQRLNLGKQQNLLSHYMQQTRDLQSAQHLARADYLTSVAAQIASAQAKMGSTVAIPASQMAIAQIRQQAVVESQSAVSRGLSIREQEINLALSQQHATALGQLLKGVSGGGGFDRRLLELPGMDKYRERSVDMPDGSVAFANDKEEANKANESMAGVAKVREKLSRYRQLLESGNPATADRTLAKSQRADILSEMGHLHSLSRLSDRDLKLFEDQVPDLTDLIKPNAGKRLDALGNSIDDVVWSYNKAILHRANAKRPGGRP